MDKSVRGGIQPDDSGMKLLTMSSGNEFSDFWKSKMMKLKLLQFFKVTYE